jgi:hypothetical protein
MPASVGHQKASSHDDLGFQCREKKRERHLSGANLPGQLLEILGDHGDQLILLDAQL